LPLDGSELAESALPCVEHLASKLSSEILLLRVVRGRRSLSALFADIFPQQAEDEARQRAEEYLRGVAERLQAKRFRVSWRVLEGIPGPAIVELVRDTPEDLVVMTTRGRSGITPGVIGSVSISVLRNSGDPVLILPPSMKQAAS
jgi:nucleotide-binding universal stress UspA family protein